MPGRREARVWDLRADPLGSARPQARRGSTQGGDSGRNWVGRTEGPDPQGMRPVTGVVPSAGLGLASGALPAECPFPDSSFLCFSPGLGGQLGCRGTRPGIPGSPSQRMHLPLPSTAGIWWRQPQSQAGESPGGSAAQEATDRSPQATEGLSLTPAPPRPVPLYPTPASRLSPCPPALGVLPRSEVLRGPSEQ